MAPSFTRNPGLHRRPSAAPNPRFQFSLVWRKTGFVTDSQQILLQALRDLRDTAARARTESPRPSLLPLLQRLDELTAALPPDTHPQLRHFLERKSYEKAIEFLEGSHATPASA